MVTLTIPFAFLISVSVLFRISYHCARHTFATMAINNGMSIESVSQILGHSSIKTTQIYTRITVSKLDNDFTVF